MQGIANQLMGHLRRAVPFIGGLGLGLYVTRVVAEATRVAWSLPGLLTLAIVTVSAGLVLARFVTRQPKLSSIVDIQLGPGPQTSATHKARPPVLWAALFLWFYVLWPRQDPTVAWGAGLTALTAWLLGTTNKSASVKYRSYRSPNLIFIFLISLVLYLLTLSPGLQPADGGEFQLVAARFGVAHPPGYPLYSLLGGTFVRLPLGSNPAWRLGLFSAITAAATLALVSYTARQMTGSAIAGAVAALALGSATTFWATATTASIRPLTAFFTALILFSLSAPRFTFHVPRFTLHASRFTFHVSRSTLHISRPTLFALALGLGLAHHASLIFFGGVALVYLLLVDPSLFHQPRRWFAPITALILTQLVWLYLPLRDAAGAPFAPGNLTTFDGLTQHILAKGFGGDMFAFATPEHLPDRLALLPTLLRFQFNPLLLVAALLGALLLLRRDWRCFILLVGSFTLHTFVTLTYRAPQTVEYEIPAYVSLALLVGQVAGKSGQEQNGKCKGATQASTLSFLPRACPTRAKLGGILGVSIIAVTLVAGFFNLVAAWPSFRDLAGRDDAREYAESLLEAVPAGTVLLSNWHWATPMWYLQQVEGLRPDVQVKYVAPQGESLAQNWVDAIAKHAVEGPVVVVRYFEPQYLGLPYRFEPLGPAFMVQTGPGEQLPPGLEPLDVNLGGQVNLVGYALENGENLRLSQPAVLTLVWTPLQSLQGDVAIFAHLLQAGRLAGQGSDRRHAATDYAPGQIILDRFKIYPFAGATPGDVQLAVGAYRPDAPDAPRLITDDGTDHVSLASMRLLPADAPPITSRPRLIPFAQGPTLVGMDWDTTVPDQPRLYLHWQGRSSPTTLDIAIRQGDEILAQAQVRLPETGYVSTVHDLPQPVEHTQPKNAASLVLTANTRAINAWGLAREHLPLPAPRPGERYVPIGGEMVLTAVQVDEQRTLSSGDRLRYDLRLVGTQPLLRDRIVSVSLVGLAPDGNWAWRDSSDGVPALGAIPTLKWIRNSAVLDRHRLTLPPDAPDGPAPSWLQVYDHFTQTILPPLDARLLSQGLSIPLDTWMVSEPQNN